MASEKCAEFPSRMLDANDVALRQVFESWWQNDHLLDVLNVYRLGILRDQNYSFASLAFRPRDLISIPGQDKVVICAKVVS